MNPADTTRAALDAGTGTIVRTLTESAIVSVSRAVASVSQGQALAFRRGLQELRQRVPECEDRLVALHLDLGVRDPKAIADRITTAFLTSLPAVAISLSRSFSGPDIVPVQREASAFGSWIQAHVASIPARTLVAVELRRNRDLAMAPRQSMQSGPLPTSRPRALSDLLIQAEGPSLDWKRDFPAGLSGGREHPQREEHRGKLLKSLASIANSVVDERGYLIYGIDDKASPREVVGVQSSFDDAMFQDWNIKTFDPPIRFGYRQELYEGKQVAIFEIVPASEYPHVCLNDVGSELRSGQVWFRRGTRNTLAGYSDMRRMFAQAEPLRTSDDDGALVKLVREYWEPLGWEAIWPTLDERDEKLAQGFRLAYALESRREIRLSRSNSDSHVLMLRRR